MNDEDLAQYVPIDIAAIQPESAASFSIYIRARKGYALFRDSGAGFDDEALAQLSGAGVDTVYIKSGDQELLDQYLNGVIASRSRRFSRPDAQEGQDDWNGLVRDGA